jgi:murein DD-endopeptidase MepM/ murein hydrolase activator NlpD/Zn-dependent protease
MQHRPPPPFHPNLRGPNDLNDAFRASSSHPGSRRRRTVLARLASAVAVVFLWSNVLAPALSAASTLFGERRGGDRRQWRRPPEPLRFAAAESASGVLVPTPLSAVRSDPLVTFAPDALSGSSAPADLPGWLRAWDALGALELESFGGGTGSPVLVVKDLHGHEAAQKGVTDFLLASVGRRPTLVGVEGATGPLDFSGYRGFPNPAATRAIAEGFLAKGWIQGVELAGLTGPEGALAVVGVEDPDLYRGNVEAFRAARAGRGPAVARGEEWRRTIETLKAAGYTEAQRRWDAAVSRHRSRGRETRDHVERLWRDAAPADAERNFPETVRFRAAAALERALDFRRAEQERAAVVERVSQELPARRLEGWIEKTLSYRLGRLDHGAYYAYVLDLCREAGLDLRGFPHFHAYARYVKLASSVDRRRFFEELAALEDLAWRSTRPTARQDALRRASDDLDLLDRLFRQDLTDADWDVFRARRTEIAGGDERLRRLGGAAEPMPSGAVDAAAAFYEFALRRNGALVRNLLAAEAPSGAEGPRVLVAGGFHAAGLVEELKRAGRPWAVAGPRVASVADGHETLSGFLRARSPLDRVLLGERLFLAGAVSVGATPLDAETAATQTVEREVWGLFQSVFSGASPDEFADALARGGLAPLRRVEETSRRAFGSLEVRSVRLHRTGAADPLSLKLVLRRGELEPGAAKALAEETAGHVQLAAEDGDAVFRVDGAEAELWSPRSDPWRRRWDRAWSWVADAGRVLSAFFRGPSALRRELGLFAGALLAGLFVVLPFLSTGTSASQEPPRAERRPPPDAPRPAPSVRLEAAPARPLAEVEFSAARPKSSDPLLLTVRPAADAPVARVEGTVEGRPVRFTRGADGAFTALYGFDMDRGGGNAAVSLTVHFEDAARPAETLERRVPVSARDYGRVQNLRIGPRPGAKPRPPTPEEAERARRLAERLKREKELLVAVYSAPDAARRWDGAFEHPTAGAGGARNFGVRRTNWGVARGPHRGVDVLVGTGTPVKAANAARVAFAGDLYSSGHTVILDHGDDLFTVYMHLSRIDVRAGDTVKKGARVGLSGGTGASVSGPHLHWEALQVDRSTDGAVKIAADGRVARRYIDPTALQTLGAAAPAGRRPARASSRAPPSFGAVLASFGALLGLRRRGAPSRTGPTAPSGEPPRPTEETLRDLRADIAATVARTSSSPSTRRIAVVAAESLPPGLVPDEGAEPGLPLVGRLLGSVGWDAARFADLAAKGERIKFWFGASEDAAPGLARRLSAAAGLPRPVLASAVASGLEAVAAGVDEILAGRRDIVVAVEPAPSGRAAWRPGRLAVAFLLFSAAVVGVNALFVDASWLYAALAHLLFPAVVHPFRARFRSAVPAGGSAGVVLMDEAKARALGLTPLAYVTVVADAPAGPSGTGLGAAYALPVALKRAGLDWDRVRTIQLDAGSPSRSLSVMEALGLSMEKVDSIGAPSGRPGLRALTELIRALVRHDHRYGACALCLDGGEGMAVVVERDNNELPRRFKDAVRSGLKAKGVSEPLLERVEAALNGLPAVFRLAPPLAAAPETGLVMPGTPEFDDAVAMVDVFERTVGRRDERTRRALFPKERPLRLEASASALEFVETLNNLAAGRSALENFSPVLEGVLYHQSLRLLDGLPPEPLREIEERIALQAPGLPESYEREYGEGSYSPSTALARYIALEAYRASPLGKNVPLSFAGDPFGPASLVFLDVLSRRYPDGAAGLYRALSELSLKTPHMHFRDEAEVYGRRLNGILAEVRDEIAAAADPSPAGPAAPAGVAAGSGYGHGLNLSPSEHKALNRWSLEPAFREGRVSLLHGRDDVMRRATYGERSRFDRVLGDLKRTLAFDASFPLYADPVTGQSTRVRPWMALNRLQRVVLVDSPSDKPALWYMADGRFQVSHVGFYSDTPTLYVDRQFYASAPDGLLRALLLHELLVLGARSALSRRDLWTAARAREIEARVRMMVENAFPGYAEAIRAHVQDSRPAGSPDRPALSAVAPGLLGGAAALWFVSTHWTQPILLSALLVFSVVLHELGHVLAARWLGDDTPVRAGRLSWNPLNHFGGRGLFTLLSLGFGAAEQVRLEGTLPLRGGVWGSRAVILAGPAANLLAAAAGLGFFHLLSAAGLASPYVAWTFLHLIGINVTLGLFNLLPLPPLDGAQLTRSFLPWRLSARLDPLFDARRGLMTSLRALAVLFLVGLVFGLPQAASAWVGSSVWALMVLSVSDARGKAPSLTERLRLQNHGLGVGPVWAALEGRGVLSAIRARGRMTLDEVKSFAGGGNDGYLQVAFRVLASVGWIRRDGPPSSGGTTFSLTAAGEAALAASPRFARAWEATEAFGNMADLLAGRPTRGPPSGDRASLAEGGPPSGDRASLAEGGPPSGDRASPAEGGPPSEERASLATGGPSGASERFAALADLSARGWDLPGSMDPVVRRQAREYLDGQLTGPVLVALREAGVFARLQAGGTLRPSDLGGDRTAWDAAFRTLATQGWVTVEGEEVRLTREGRTVAGKALMYGHGVAYAPTFGHLDDILFGDPSFIWSRDAAGRERSLDRVLNVVASGANHHGYFERVDQIVIEMFNRPVEEQPRFIADMGSGDGTFLKHLYEVILTKTKRGELIRQDPAKYGLLMVGADYNEQAREETAKTLAAAGVPHQVVHGDINDPDAFARTLAAEGLDIKQGLHVRSFLDHNRPYLPPVSRREARRRASASTGAFAHRGRSLDNRDVEQSLVDHFRRWARHTGRFGLLVLELHTIPPETAAANADRTLAPLYDATHGFSDQYTVELPVFLAAAGEAGLTADERLRVTFPAGDLATISINHFLPSAVATAPPPRWNRRLKDGVARVRGAVSRLFWARPKALDAAAARTVARRGVEGANARMARGERVAASDLEASAAALAFLHEGGGSLAAARRRDPGLVRAETLDGLRRELRSRLGDARSFSRALLELLPAPDRHLSRRMALKTLSLEGAAAVEATKDPAALGLLSLDAEAEDPPADGATGDAASSVRAREAAALFQTVLNARSLGLAPADAAQRAAAAYDRGRAIRRYLSEGRGRWARHLTDWGTELRRASGAADGGALAVDLFGAGPDDVDYDAAVDVLARQVTVARAGGAVPHVVLVADVPGAPERAVEARLAAALSRAVGDGRLTLTEATALTENWLLVTREALERGGVTVDGIHDADRFHEWLAAGAGKSWGLGREFVLSILTGDESRWKASRRDHVRVLQWLLPDVAVHITRDLQDYLRARRLLDIQA